MPGSARLCSKPFRNDRYQKMAIIHHENSEMIAHHMPMKYCASTTLPNGLHDSQSLCWLICWSVCLSVCPKFAFLAFCKQFLHHHSSLIAHYAQQKPKKWWENARSVQFLSRFWRKSNLKWSREFKNVMLLRRHGLLWFIQKNSNKYIFVRFTKLQYKISLKIILFFDIFLSFASPLQLNCRWLMLLCIQVLSVYKICSTFSYPPYSQSRT